MKEHIILISPDTKSTVKIINGELVSYLKDDEELIHQKGNPGWRNSDTEMFPIIGPTETNNFRVSTPKGTCIQDQHGLLRELKYTITEKDENFCVYLKEYTANTKVKNSKYPGKSTEADVFWPYSFSFKKSYELTNDFLTINFEIEAEKGMPFMLGYHPAFMLSGDKTELCKTINEEIDIPKIIKGGSTAYPILNANEIMLAKESGTNIKLITEGFNNFMLWTEVPNMLCIEPITKYPYTGNKELTEDMFTISSGIEEFKTVIKPF
ncbi:aldose 1-epimerase [Lutibacter sp. B1]|uniref:aldose epimerase family protein n=1 Tax=Lutibacter sp. B1 TaxID=2725996 RepID=UPI0014573C22|nr:aldose 1-epimerase [Lutibacter sp. B1]NLP58410.1 aldose 1-epimerase [Lutibacter sp. B1]